MANLPGIIQQSDLAGFTATATSAGVIFLTGDLGGTASLPEVVGLLGIPLSSTPPVANEVLTFNGSAWVPTFLGSMALGGDLRGSLLDATVVGIQGIHIAPYGPATSGTSTSGLNPSTNLTGLSPAATAAIGITVDGLNLPFVTFNALTSLTGVSIAANLQLAINNALTAATSTTLTQSLTTSGPPTPTVTLAFLPSDIPLVSGFTYTAGSPGHGQFTVDFLTGVLTFHADAHDTLVVVTYNYTQPTLSVTVTYTGTVPTNFYTITSNSQGITSSVVVSSPVFVAPLPNYPDVTPLLKLGVANGGTEAHGTSSTIPPGYVLTSGASDTATWLPLPTTLPPSGPAGGGLGGSYPNPTVVEIQAVAISSTPPTVGQVLTATSPTAADWQTIPPEPPTGPAGGDLAGTYPNPTIAILPAISGAALTNLTAANISAGTASISITGNAATATLSSTVTTNANLTGDVTSVGNATTIVNVEGSPVSALMKRDPHYFIVGPTGDYSTLAAAIAGIGTPTVPTTIFVQQGTYNEITPITINCGTTSFAIIGGNASGPSGPTTTINYSSVTPAITLAGSGTISFNNITFVNTLGVVVDIPNTFTGTLVLATANLNTNLGVIPNALTSESTTAVFAATLNSNINGGVLGTFGFFYLDDSFVTNMGFQPISFLTGNGGVEINDATVIDTSATFPAIISADPVNITGAFNQFNNPIPSFGNITFAGAFIGALPTQAIMPRDSNFFVVGSTGDYPTLSAAITGIGPIGNRNIYITIQDNLVGGLQAETPITIDAQSGQLTISGMIGDKLSAGLLYNSVGAGITVVGGQVTFTDIFIENDIGPCMAFTGQAPSDDLTLTNTFLDTNLGVIPYALRADTHGALNITDGSFIFGVYFNGQGAGDSSLNIDHASVINVNAPALYIANGPEFGTPFGFNVNYSSLQSFGAPNPAIFGAANGYGANMGTNILFGGGGPLTSDNIGTNGLAIGTIAVNTNPGQLVVLGAVESMGTALTNGNADFIVNSADNSTVWDISANQGVGFKIRDLNTSNDVVVIQNGAPSTMLIQSSGGTVFNGDTSALSFHLTQGESLTSVTNTGPDHQYYLNIAGVNLSSTPSFAAGFIEVPDINPINAGAGNLDIIGAIGNHVGQNMRGLINISANSVVNVGLAGAGSANAASVIISAGYTDSLVGGNIDINTGENFGGQSLGLTNPAVTSTVGTETLTLAINGETPFTITFGVDASGAAIAADIQAQVRAHTPDNAPLNGFAYAGFTASYQTYHSGPNPRYILNAPGDPYIVNPGGLVSSVVVTIGLSAPDIAAGLGLGLGNGGNESSGNVGSFSVTLGQGGTPQFGGNMTFSGGGQLFINSNGGAGTENPDCFILLQASYPWLLVSNFGSSNFEIADGNTSNTPFVIQGGAPNDVIHITGAGAVGFNTPTPTALLDLEATGLGFPAIKIVDGTQGVGKVLTSDGGGVGTWQSLPPSADFNVPVITVTTFTVTHNLGYYPIVQIIDNSGFLVIPNSVQHTDTNNFTVTWATSFTGTIIYR